MLYHAAPIQALDPDPTGPMVKSDLALALRGGGGAPQKLLSFSHIGLKLAFWGAFFFFFFQDLFLSFSYFFSRLHDYFLGAVLRCISKPWNLYGGYHYFFTLLMLGSPLPLRSWAQV